MLVLIGLGDFGAAVRDFLTMIGIYINSLIYNFVSFLYQVFIAISSARLFSSDDYSKLANGIYLVVGVIALFIIAYALLRAIINPDNASKGENSVAKVVPNVLIVIALIAFVPTIFNLAYKTQEVVIGSNVIPRLIMYSSTGNGTNASLSDFKDAGRDMATDVFLGFLTPIEDSSLIETSDCYFGSCDDVGGGGEDAYTFADAEDAVRNGDANFTVFANFGDSINGKNKKIEYNFLFQLVAGILVIYVLLNYCIDIAVRTVKLAYFQLIAPLPILTRLLPGQKKVFDNWLKSSVSTYLDMFIRISVIYLGIYLINLLPDISGKAWQLSIFTFTSAESGWAKAFIIVGILIFIKQAPKLIQDLTGISSGSFKLGIGEKLGEMALLGNTARSLQGGITGALGAGWSAKWNGVGFRQGAKYGFANGWKGKGNQFNNQRQGIYKNAFGGEGTAGWFGKRSYLNQMGADINKETKNSYREANFNRLNAFEQRSDFKEKYEASYSDYRSKLETQRTNIENARNKEIQEYNNTITDLKTKIAAKEGSVAALQQKQDEFNRKSLDFEQEKAEMLQNYRADYERAKDRGDSAAQLAASTRISALEGSKFSDAKLENEIRSLQSAQADLASLNNQLNRVQTQLKNDSSLDNYNNQIKAIDDQLKAAEAEYTYMNSGHRTLASDKKMEFTDAVKDARAKYEKEHPEYHDVYDTYSKYRNEDETSKFMKSKEGQQLSAAIGKNASKIGAGVKVDAPKDKK